MIYSHQIAGNVDDGFTSADILNEKEEPVARVFELSSGWFVEMPDLEALRDQSLLDAILAARDNLKHYPNRQGGVFPEDATRAAVSLWLMQRDDGKGFSIPDNE